MNLSTRAGTGTETPPVDRIRENFLRCQREEGLALAGASDLLDLQPIGGAAAEKYIATYHCRGLVRGQNGQIGAAHRFDVEPELTAKILMAKKWRVYEMPISYYGRTYEEGKKIGWRDGVLAVWTLVRIRFGG